MLNSALILLNIDLTATTKLLILEQFPKVAEYTFRPDSASSILATRSNVNVNGDGEF